MASGAPNRGSGAFAAPRPHLLPPPLRAFLTDGLVRAGTVLIIVTLLGAMAAGRIAGRFAPPDAPATGVIAPAAHVYPVFSGVPTKVETNSKPLTITLRATGTRYDAGHSIARFVYAARPPNDNPFTLCDSNFDPNCPLMLTGSRRQAGTWVLSLTVYDDNGVPATTETRMRVR